MELKTLQYITDKGWSAPFPDLDSDTTLILIFAAPEFITTPEPIKTLAHHYPKSKIIGCSTAGEISGAAILDKSISVAIVRFAHTTIKIVKKELSSAEHSFATGQHLAHQLEENNLRSIFVLSTGLDINGTALVEGFNTLKNKKIVITGGLAGDGARFKQTWVIWNGEIYSNHVVAVGLYGHYIKIGHASRGGWDIFGPERRITRSKDNILYELDGKPALALYKEYLGERSAELPASGLLFPLAIRQDIADARQLVRTILAVDKKTQSLTFAGEMPMGYLAQLMRANFERIIASANSAAETAIKHIFDHPQLRITDPILTVAISCVGRRLLLGERTEEELESIIEALPATAQQVGFYSYGELSPYTTGNCDLHNQTMTLTIFRETSPKKMSTIREE